MTDINALLDSLKGGSKVEKTSSVKKKTSADSSENATGIFAALLSSSLNNKDNVQSKGQNSSAAGKDKGAVQDTDTDDSQQISSQGNAGLGYGSLMFPLLIQSILQGSIPAGKEANSGNAAAANSQSANVQGTEAIKNLVSSSAAGLNEALQVSSDENSAATGMEPSNSQGSSPANTELDQYKQVIAELLEKLSGEISSPQGTELGSGSSKVESFYQNMVKNGQALMALNNADGKGNQDSNVQVLSNQSEISKINSLLENLSAKLSVNSGSNDKIAALQAALSLISGYGAKDTNDIKDIKKIVAEINKAAAPEGGTADLDSPKSSESSLKQAAVSNLTSDVKSLKDTASLTHNQQKSAGGGNQGNESFSEDPEQTAGTSEVKNVQDQSVGLGAANNISAAKAAEKNSAAVPVWKQISEAVYNQVMNRHQEVKNLDIQLQPAELGKIHINMNWDNGVVHLQVQASETATSQILQNQLSDLRQNLMDQGVNCGTLQMGQDGGRQQSRQGNEPQKSFKQGADRNEDESLTLDVGGSSLESEGINRVNIRA